MTLPLSVLFFDFLVWLLIVFPWITGGIWIRKPGLFIELSDISIPTLLVALLALLLKKGFHAPLERASSWRAASALWRFWTKSMTARPIFALSSGWLFSSLILASAALFRHWGLESHSFDLGIFTNAIFNLTHGGGYVSSLKGGINLFFDHQSPAFWLFAPFFSLFPRPETLLVLQALLISSGGFFVYLLGRPYLAGQPRLEWALSALPVVFWFYLPFRNANAYDFHPETIMLPAFLGALAGLHSVSFRGRVLGALSLIVALMAKESAGPIAVGIGLAWLLGAAPQTAQAFTKKIAPWTIALGLAVFVFDLKIVPHLLGGGYAYAGLYSQYGSSVSEILHSPFTRPELFFSQLFGPARLKFLFFTLAPLGFLPLLNWRVWPALLPGYLMLFLSAGDQRVSIIHHYVIEPGVGLFWALPGAIVMVVTRWTMIQNVIGTLARTLPIWVLFWSTAMAGRSEMTRIRRSFPDDYRRFLASEVLPCIAPGVPLMASDALVPHLATRPWIQGLDQKFSQQPPIQCALYDSTLSNWPLSPTEARNRVPASLSPSWSCQSFTIFSSGSIESCLRCLPRC